MRLRRSTSSVKTMEIEIAKDERRSVASFGGTAVINVMVNACLSERSAINLHRSLIIYRALGPTRTLMAIDENAIKDFSALSHLPIQAISTR